MIPQLTIVVFEIIELAEHILVLTVYYELQFVYFAMELGVLLVKGTFVKFKVTVEHVQTKALGLDEHELSS